jgi:hypothetical protein
MTEADFAFWAYVTGFEPVTLCLKRQMLHQSELYATYCDVLPRLLRHLLDHAIQHAAFFSSRELLRSLLRPALSLTLPLTVQTAPEPSIAKSRTDGTTLSHTDWLVGFAVRPAPPAALRLPVFPCGHIGKRSFHYASFVVTSTGFLSEGHLAVLSRLA